MWSKRATWALGDLLYWFFWIPATVILITALVYIPGQAFDRMVQPVPLDAGVMQERLENKVSHYSATRGFQEYVLSEKYKRADKLAFSEKKYAYKITVGNEYFVSNEEFYEDAAPLAPIKYDRFIHTTTRQKHGRSVPVIIDQVFLKKYEKVPIT